MSTLREIPIFVLAALVFTGAFSRFTHGRYTPGFYAFQEYHAPDDGGVLALITPCADVITGCLLLWPRRCTRQGAALFALVTFGIGLVMQVAAGKDFRGDLAIDALAAGAVWAAFSR